jgi:FeS assembly SUF system protein
MNEQRAILTQEVEAVTPPPRARVEDAAPLPDGAARKRDYLEGFLAQQPAQEASGEPGGDLYEAIIAALREIYDPEIPVNIYDLGLIYGVDVGDDGHAVVTMTLTTPHCPVAESMPAEVELRVGAVPGVGDAQVNLVWDPPWDPQKMSDEAKLELGML